MSPTIPILSALLLLLISGSTEGVPKMSPTALLRQTFRYWRKIYNTYHEELALGYCWADYLFKIRNELSTNLSALSLATTGDRSNTTVGATKSQQNPFPQNVMADATTPLRETQRGKHLREKRSHATARSSISRFTNNPDGHQIVSSMKIIQEQEKWIVNQTRQALSIISYNIKENNKVDGDKRTIPMIDFYIEERRHALTIVPELFHNEELKAPRGHEFSSHGTSSRIVNPASNPEDDDKVGFGSMDQGDARRKVLRPSHHGSFVEGGFGPRSFSLKVSRGRQPRSLDDHRFPFRCSLPRKRNSRVDKPLSNPGMLKEDRGMRTDLVGRRVPLNNDGSSSTPSRSHFRRANAAAERRRTVVVKLMDFEENSSCDPAVTINSKTPHRKPEKLSRDSLLSPRGERIAVAERSSLEFRGSEGEAVKRKASPRFETTGGSDTKKRRYQQSREEKRSRTGRDVSEAPVAIHPYFRGVGRLHQQMLYENWVFFPVRRATIPKGSRQGDNLIRAVRSAPSLPRVRFIGDYEDSTTQSAQNSRSRNRDQLSLVQPPSFVSSLSSIIIAVFRTLGMFVEVGGQIMDIVESNSALVCTKEYLWTKIITWIDG